MVAVGRPSPPAVMAVGGLLQLDTAVASPVIGLEVYFTVPLLTILLHHTYTIS